jgi:hypothetical protein
MPVLIEETVIERLAGAVAYAGWFVDHIDPTRSVRQTE